MKDKEASVDILKMFTAMMAVLTTVVIAAFVFFYNQVGEAKQEVEDEMRNLKSMYELGIDPDFKELVYKYRQQQVVASRGSLQSWIQEKNRNGILTIVRNDAQNVKASNRNPPLERVSLQIKGVPLQNLTGFLFDLQNQWPGLRVEDLTIRGFKLNVGWDVNVDISVIQAEEPSRES